MDIFDKFDDNIPHILFHGNIDYTKILNCIYNLYNTKCVNKYVLELECVTSKSIKNIRENIKLFSKQQISYLVPFKSIILFDAEYLTMDAQYSLRRIIEIYSKNTRFFIITKNKDKLLQPIRSRFIHIYMNEPILNEKIKIPYSTIKNIFDKELSIHETIEECIKYNIYGKILLLWMKNKINNYHFFKYKYQIYSKEFKNESWILFYMISFFRNNTKL